MLITYETRKTTDYALHLFHCSNARALIRDDCFIRAILVFRSEVEGRGKKQKKIRNLKIIKILLKIIHVNVDKLNLVQ